MLQHQGCVQHAEIPGACTTHQVGVLLVNLGVAAVGAQRSSRHEHGGLAVERELG